MFKLLIKAGLKYTFVRFILVGILNTAFGLSVYLLLIYFGLPYMWAVMISTILGVLFNFKTIGILVFKNRDNRLIIKFVLSYVITYFVNIGIISLLLKYTSINEYYAGIIATPIVALLSFFIHRYYVYGRVNSNNSKKEETNE